MMVLLIFWLAVRINFINIMIMISLIAATDLLEMTWSFTMKIIKVYLAMLLLNFILAVTNGVNLFSIKS